MVKKKESLGKDNSLTDSYTEKRREILNLCYQRLREMIPECTNEVNLLKCIEMLEKCEDRAVSGNEQQALCSIADTLDRLAGLR